MSSEQGKLLRGYSWKVISLKKISLFFAYTLFICIWNITSKAMMKYHYTDSPLNFEGRPVVPLSNFDGVPGVPLLNFEGDPRSSGSGPTFILCSLI